MRIRMCNIIHFVVAKMIEQKICSYYGTARQKIRTDSGIFLLLCFDLHPRTDRAQDSNLDLPEVNIIRLPLPLDEHDFVFRQISRKQKFVVSFVSS